MDSPRISSRKLGVYFFMLGLMINNLCNGNIANFNFIDGECISPQIFFPNNGTENKEYTGDFGPNGFNLLFRPGEVGKDSSGNGNDFDTIQIDDNNVSTDAPENVLAFSGTTKDLADEITMEEWKIYQNTLKGL